jgi:hypothetical protein
VAIYSASFTTGALLTDETEAVITFQARNEGEDQSRILKNDRYLKVNSLAGRKRRLREILNRINSVPAEHWNFYLRLKARDEKNVFMYYVCMKYYALIRDFHLEVILSKWRLLDSSFSKEDVSRFLTRASIQHPEIDEWTESTQKKIVQVLTLMLKESGIVLNEKIRLVFLPDTFWLFFIEHGEGWFLEAMFLTREQRDLLYKKAGL